MKRVKQSPPPTKIVSLIFMFAMVALIFNACRRNDLSTEKKTTEQQEKEAIAALKERYKNVTEVPVTIELNQKLEPLVLMENDEEISWAEYVKRRNNGLVTEVIPDNCLEAPEVTILNTSYHLSCATGAYVVSGKYRLLVDAQIVPQSPSNAANKTAGRIRYFNTSNT